MALLATMAMAGGVAHAATSVIVQDSENTDHGSDGRGAPGGLELVAHRYESASDTTGTLTLAAAGSRIQWNSITVFDLDRDGIADAEVIVQPGTPGSANDAQATATAWPLPASRTFTDAAGNRCVNPDPAGLSGSTTPVTNSVGLSGNELTFSATFTWPTALQSLARYAPRMTTIALQPGVPNPYYIRSNDEIPNAAGAGAVGYMSTACRDASFNPTGVILDPAKGSDRGFSGAAGTIQDFSDPADAGADVRGAHVEQWTVTTPTADVATNIYTTKNPQTFHPTDLVLDLPASGGFDATGWLAAGYTTSDATSAPIGMVAVHRDPGAATADVELWRTPPAPNAVDNANGESKCFPNTAPAVAGNDYLKVTLPLGTAADGDRTLRVVTDSLLHQQVNTAGTNRTTFRWGVVANDLTSRDSVPDTVDNQPTGTAGAPPPPCNFSGGALNDGTRLKTRNLALFNPTSVVLGATLSVSNDHPDKGQSITLSATNSSQLTYRWDVADQRFGSFLSSSSTQTASFQQSYTARVAVSDTFGSVAILEHRISVANRPPVARIAVNGAAPAAEYGLGDGGTTLLFSGAGSDDPDGTPIGTYAWTLTPAGGTPVTGSGPSFTYTFKATGDYTLQLRVEDPEGEPATTTSAFRISTAPPPAAAPTKPPVMTLAGPDSAELGVDGTATATFDATGSHGANSDQGLTYQWDLDGDGRFETSTGASPKATARFTTRGARTITVLGIDRYGNTATAKREIVVRSYLDADCATGALLRTVTYGPVKATACFLRVDRPTAGPLWIASGTLNLNGLIITGARGSTAATRTFADCDAEACQRAAAFFNDPRKGIALALDPYDGKLASNAPVAITATGTEVNLPLSLSAIDVTLPFSPRDDGFIIRVPDSAALFGFPLTGQAEVRFPADGETDVRVTADGSGLLDGISGDVHLHAYQNRGVVLDHLKLGFQEGLLKKLLRIKELSLEYDRAQQLWAGSAVVVIPAGRPVEVGASASVLGGRFKSVAGSVFGINQHLGKGIFLQGIRFGVAVDPLDLSGGITLSAGPAVKIKGEPRTLLRADGDFRLTFPSRFAPYTMFSLDATLSLLDKFQLTHSTLRFTDTGFTEMRMGIGGDYGFAYFDAAIDGWFTATQFNASGDAEVGLKISGKRVALLGAHAVVSTKGVAACGEISVINLGGGLGYRWGEDFATFDGCDLSPYSEVRPADAPAAITAAVRHGAGDAHAAAGQVPTLDVPAGTPSVSIKLAGEGGAPNVRVLDADGKTVFQTGEDELTAQRLVMHDAANGQTTILWKAPPAGRYAIVAAPGSVALKSTLQAVGRTEPVVHASVSGAGQRRVLSWSVTPKLADGERVTFSETGRDGQRELLTTAASAGRLPFTPPAGSGTRTVRALVTSPGGLSRAPVAVARYGAPRLVLPGTPRGVVATRGRRTVAVAFRAPSTGGPASSYRVTLRAAGRTLAKVTTRPRRLTFTGVGAAQAARVEVRALGPGNLAGGVRTVTVRAGAARSGAGRRADVTPRALKVSRRGSVVTITWKAGRELARGYRVSVRIGKKAYKLSASPLRRVVRIKKAPKGAVHVTVTPLRLSGGTGPAARR